jgi:hypothetical protein
MGNCSWFKIEERRLAGNGSNGDLYKISARAWELPYSDPAPLEGGKLLTYYVFCSMVRPAVMFQTSKGDRWFVHTLAPGKDDGVFGYNEDDYKIYFSVCHNVVINNVHDDSADLGRKLGYNINSESVDQTEIQRPEDIFDYDLKAKGVK